MCHSAYTSQACNLQSTASCASISNTVSTNPQCTPSLLLRHSLPRSICPAAPLSDQAYFPGNHHKWSAVPCQVCTLRPERITGRYRSPPCLGRCPVCSRLGRQLELCVWGLAEDALTCLFSLIVSVEPCVAGMLPVCIFWRSSSSSAITMYRCSYHHQV